MNARAKNILKVAIFCGFVSFSILIGSSWILDPPMPTRVGDSPYAVSLKQLDTYAAQLEGQPIVITSDALSVHVNSTSGDVQFAISDDLFGISEQVLLRGWAPGGEQPAGATVSNGTIVVIKGVCRLSSIGIIEGTEIHVLLPDNVYLVSISGLVVIGAMLFLYFRLDIKRARFTAKKIGNTKAKPEGT